MAIGKVKNAFDQPDARELQNIAKDDEGKAQISEFVTKYLESQNLVVLEGSKVSRALEKYIDKGEQDAIGACVDPSISFSFNVVKLLRLGDINQQVGQTTNQEYDQNIGGKL